MLEWDTEMTHEQIMDMLRKVVKEHFKYTMMFCIGFIKVDNEHVFLAKKERQNGKEIVLMKAGCSLHEYVKTIEKEEDISFERVNEETREKLWYFFFTDEDGNEIERTYEYKPITFDVKPEYDKIINSLWPSKLDLTR